MELEKKKAKVTYLRKQEGIEEEVGCERRKTTYNKKEQMKRYMQRGRRPINYAFIDLKTKQKNKRRESLQMTDIYIKSEKIVKTSKLPH